MFVLEKSALIGYTEHLTFKMSYIDYLSPTGPCSNLGCLFCIQLNVSTLLFVIVGNSYYHIIRPYVMSNDKVILIKKFSNFLRILIFWAISLAFVEQKQQ